MVDWTDYTLLRSIENDINALGSMERMGLENKLAITEIHKGNDADDWDTFGLRAPFGIIAKTPVELERMYKALSLAQPHSYQPDFSKETVVAVFLGEKTTRGHNVSIVNVVEKDVRVYVRADVTTPKAGPALPVMSYPVHVVAVPYFGGKNFEFNFNPVK